MESPVQGRPNRETGLPPGVEVGPLGKRFVAYLINLSVPVIVSIALIFLLPNTTGAPRVIVGLLGAGITVAWLVVVWYTLAVRAASPGLRASSTAGRSARVESLCGPWCSGRCLSLGFSF